MKMQISIDDVIEVLPEGGGTKLPKNVTYKPAPELAPVHQEINVIGQRAEEARDAVDDFLDRAVMATASRVRIVHGHGMGVLKRMVAEMLSKHPHVSRFYPRPRMKAARGLRLWNYGNSVAANPGCRPLQSADLATRRATLGLLKGALRPYKTVAAATNGCRTLAYRTIKVTPAGLVAPPTVT